VFIPSDLLPFDRQKSHRGPEIQDNITLRRDANHVCELTIIPDRKRVFPPWNRSGLFPKGVHSHGTICNTLSINRIRELPDSWTEHAIPPGGRDRSAPHCCSDTLPENYNPVRAVHHALGLSAAGMTSETRCSDMDIRYGPTFLYFFNIFICSRWSSLTKKNSFLLSNYIAYWVAFGPHGARTPLTGPNHGLKVFAGTAAVVAAAGGLFLWIRAKGTLFRSAMINWRPGSFSCRLLKQRRLSTEPWHSMSPGTWRSDRFVFQGSASLH